MTDLKIVEQEFNKYVDNYPKIEKILLKKKHTKNVAKFSYEIATWYVENKENEEIIKQAGGKEKFINLATAIGWLHDLGRFEQAKLYDSFDDSKTFDHAEYGVKILKENNYISKYCDEEKFHNTIYTAIYNHNKIKIEENLNEFDQVHSKIIRDADKLDILRVYVERLENYKKEDNNNRKTTLKMMQDIMAKKLINKKDKKTHLDRYLLALGFTFDINYKKSLEILKEKNYINLIIDELIKLVTPEEIQEFEQIRKISNQYIEEKIK